MAEEEGEYKLRINPLGLALPIGAVILGLMLYFLNIQTGIRVFGLLLAFMGFASLLGLSFPMLQLYKAKLKLQEEEQQVKLDRLEEKVKAQSKNKAHEEDTAANTSN